MRGNNTIFINGRHYDAVTGVQVAQPRTPVRPTRGRGVISDIAPASSQPTRSDLEQAAAAIPKNARQNIQRSAPVASVHAAPQRSQTLRREAVKRPVGVHETVARRDRRQPAQVAKSPLITKFAPHPQSHTDIITAPVPAPIAASPTVSHLHNSLLDRTAASVPQKAAPQTAKATKDKLIAEGLAKASTTNHTKTHKTRTVKRGSKASRTLSTVTACLALVVFAGYLTYLNMPNLSVRVAAAQAGINASFPEYRPDGYRFNGPIAYAPGEVTVRFTSSSGSEDYEIKQQNSNWDSQAVLDNYVTQRSESYLTYSEQGLTIYTYEGNAAWVNGGILYTIEGDAPLSSQQVLRIAGSM